MKRSRSVALAKSAATCGKLVGMDQQTLEASAASLRAVIEEIDTGELQATASERAYLAGSVETLERLSRS